MRWSYETDKGRKKRAKDGGTKEMSNCWIRLCWVTKAAGRFGRSELIFSLGIILCSITAWRGRFRESVGLSPDIYRNIMNVITPSIPGWTSLRGRFERYPALYSEYPGFISRPEDRLPRITWQLYVLVHVQERKVMLKWKLWNYAISSLTLWMNEIHVVGQEWVINIPIWCIVFILLVLITF